MADVKIVLNSAGIQELLKSDEVKELCREHAQRTLDNAGDGFVMEERNYPERSGYAVRPETEKAFYKNLQNNTLLKALS